jgi:hypothetical protein
MIDIHDDDCICDLEPTKQKKIKTSILHKSIYDKALISPSQIYKKDYMHPKSAKEPKAIVSKCASMQPIKLEDMEIDKVLVEYRIKGLKKPSSNTPRIESKRVMQPPKRLPICESLKLAGFRDDWTKEKVTKLMNTPDGSELLKHVNEQYKQFSGKSILSERDILSCYPNYLKKEKRNVELVVQLDGDENIISVSEKSNKLNTKKKQ